MSTTATPVPVKKPWYKYKRLWAILIVVGFLFNACSGEDTQSVADAIEQQETQAPTPTPEPAPETTPAPAPAPVAPAPAPAPETTAEEPAYTPSNEELYTLTLDVGGVEYSSEAAAITAGRSICDAFDEGNSLAAVGMIAVTEGGYSVEDAGYILGAAVSAFCPEHQDLFE